MAQIPNTSALSEGDGLNTYVNIDTLNKLLQILNGAGLKFYSDAGATTTLQIIGGLLGLPQSATAPAIANAGTIATTGLGVSRLSPAGAVTGIIMAAGTIPGQLCLVVNEAAQANSLTFNATPGTSFVADSANEQPIYGLQSRLFVWDSAQSLWYPVGNALIGGTTVPLLSATSPDPGANGAIATAGVGIALVTPAAARTGITINQGTINGQELWIVNQGAAANTLTLNTTPATANVADSATETALAGLTARKYVWVSAASLWYPSRD